MTNNMVKTLVPLTYQEDLSTILIFAFFRRTSAANTYPSPRTILINCKFLDLTQSYAVVD